MPLARPLSASVTRFSREARFIFTGTVQRPASSSLAFVQPSQRTAVVRVERIYRAAAGLRDHAGQDVTVIGADDDGNALDHRAWVFFTNPVLYGETVGVREVGRIEVPDDADALYELIARVTHEQHEQRRREHLEAADAAVLGRVVSTRPGPEPDPATRSEHDPEWWIAVVEVVRSLKGDLHGEIEVRFPKSRDVRWYRVPKPAAGDEALFLLHRDGLRTGGAVFAILDPQDVQPADIDVEKR